MSVCRRSHSTSKFKQVGTLSLSPAYHGLKQTLVVKASSEGRKLIEQLGGVFDCELTYLINPAVAIIAVSGRLCRDSPHCHPTVSQGLNESQLKSSELTRISFSLPRATCSREPQSDRRQAITCMFPLPRIQCGCRSAFGIPQLRRGAAKIVT